MDGAKNPGMIHLLRQKSDRISRNEERVSSRPYAPKDAFGSRLFLPDQRI